MPNIVKKTFRTTWAGGNHLLTQAKANQPKLLLRLERGAKGRKPSGADVTQTKARNRSERRRLTVYPAKAWFKNTPWSGLIKTVLRIERIVQRRNAKTGLWSKSAQTTFYLSSAERFTPAQWNQIIRGHWRIENASHYVRDVAFGEDASRIRKNPDIAARLRSFAYNILRCNGSKNIKDDRWNAALNIKAIFQMIGV